jgi:hypothetical protein
MVWRCGSSGRAPEFKFQSHIKNKKGSEKNDRCSKISKLENYIQMTHGGINIQQGKTSSTERRKVRMKLERMMFSLAEQEAHLTVNCIPWVGHC